MTLTTDDHWQTRALRGHHGGDRGVIQCNYLTGTRVAVAGSRAFVVCINPGNDNDRIEVLVRSRSGRLVRKWEAMHRLYNFRVKWLPPDHPRYADERVWSGTRSQCERVTHLLNAAATMIRVVRSEES